MACDTGNPTSGLGRVLFPPDLLHHLDDVLDSLHSKLIDAAAERARSRSKTIEDCVVGARDIAETAPEFFATAASELERTLLKNEPRHGRVRKAS